ncbi:sugar phosphate isomerase/epimerase family protein [Nocardia barduliensis]|uniref:sugar phosphate isomerase/epimerase family protein n=1 Tax=Nocardia barduliensis TaxID=2736643 RepID=UPI001571F0A6|nr:sugar phosphate isomerase/epimerase family protein [Nocardia barduliensis]
MKLAVIGDEIAQDIEVVADVAAGAGARGVEVRSVADRAPGMLTRPELQRIRNALDAKELEVAGYAPPAFKCPLPITDEECALVADELAGFMEQAAVLGAPHVRIFTFWREGEPDPVRAARAAARVLSEVRSEIPLVVETGTRTNTPTMRHVLAFLEELSFPGLGILWDPGNTVFSGWDPAPFPEDYAAGGTLIRHVHVKDPDGMNGYVRIGSGDLPWPAILRRLAEDGYAGYLSLETHWRIGRVLSALERDSPWGDAFSRDGQAASVECLGILRTMLDQTSRVEPPS